MQKRKSAFAELERQHTSHHDAAPCATLIEGSVSRYDPNPHLWALVGGSAPAYMTPVSQASSIEAREQWSADWVTHFAEGARTGTLSSAFCFGVNVPTPERKDNPLRILDRYA